MSEVYVLKSRRFWSSIAGTLFVSLDSFGLFCLDEDLV